ncbi:pyridoxal 5'-phosphate synthase glutaminase subunit PdxT [candidate division WOR-3 bacterium]|nr:pyridoxal 5'-phosphate synthase glutaminase subunit PdxT [candidate division WOR-3 bacterium]
MVTKIAVVALQGDYDSHSRKVLEYFRDSKVFFIRKPGDFPETVDLIIIPGGESSTISILSDLSRLGERIISETEKGVALFGTCAGSIMLSKNILNPGRAKPWSLIDIETERNAYGRQVDSSVKEIRFTSSGRKFTGTDSMNGIFIRAPRITRTGNGVQVLAESEGSPVLVIQNRIIACTFHPELSDGFDVYRIIESIIVS